MFNLHSNKFRINFSPANLTSKTTKITFFNSKLNLKNTPKSLSDPKTTIESQSPIKNSNKASTQINIHSFCNNKNQKKIHSHINQTFKIEHPQKKKRDPDREEPSKKVPSLSQPLQRKTAYSNQICSSCNSQPKTICRHCNMPQFLLRFKVYKKQ